MGSFRHARTCSMLVPIPQTAAAPRVNSLQFKGFGLTTPAALSARIKIKGCAGPECDCICLFRSPTRCALQCVIGDLTRPTEGQIMLGLCLLSTRFLVGPILNQNLPFPIRVHRRTPCAASRVWLEPLRGRRQEDQPLLVENSVDRLQRARD